jgi:MoxR-like ATPase
MLHEQQAVWCPPAFLPRSGEGILFLDELAQAVPMVQEACLQLVLDRQLGEYHLPDGWHIVAASNRSEDRAGTHRLISPLLNRFVHLDLEVSFDDWQRAFPTPRSWHYVSDLLHRAPHESAARVIAGCVGDGAAAEFLGFWRLYRELPDVEVALAQPDLAPVPREPAVLYALVGALVEVCRRDTASLAAFVKYVTRLPDEFTMLALRDALSIQPQLIALPAVQQWIATARSKGLFLAA